jgi:BarA-like signal transduction histidine kinase
MKTANMEMKIARAFKMTYFVIVTLRTTKKSFAKRWTVETRECSCRVCVDRMTVNAGTNAV